MTPRPGLARRFGEKVLRRLLRRQVEINASFQARLERLERAAGEVPAPDLSGIEARLIALELRQTAVEDRADTTLALGWDHVALVRSLARIEDRFDRLEGQRSATPPPDESCAA